MLVNGVLVNGDSVNRVLVKADFISGLGFLKDPKNKFFVCRINFGGSNDNRRQISFFGGSESSGGRIMFLVVTGSVLDDLGELAQQQPGERRRATLRAVWRSKL